MVYSFWILSLGGKYRRHNKKQKLIGIILALAMALSLSGQALCAEAEARQTGFFAEVPHSQTDFADMKYKHIEAEPILTLIEEARGLLGDASNAQEVEELYDRISDVSLEMSTMRVLISLLSYQDIRDEDAAAESAWCAERDELANDAIRALVRDILNSPCAAFLEEQLGPDGVEQYRQYKDMTDRQREMRAREIALMSEYNALAGQTFTDAANKNETLGEFFLELAAVRRELAEAYGYDSYAEYAYEQTYGRDYTPEEIRSFHAAVKEYIVFLSGELQELRDAYRQVDEYKALLDGEYIAYAGDTSMDMIEPYLGRLSSELLESFEYLRRYHLYDLDPGDAKADGGFTAQLYRDSAAFIFGSPSGKIRDFQTVIHEFGHYNKFYYTDWTWERSAHGDDYDVDAMEVPSQGLEALFLHFYPEIFGELAPAVETYEVTSLVSSLVDGALQDEFQQYVYTAGSELTLEKLNEKYYELCVEYDVLGDNGEFKHDWVDYPHTFNAPCYYIAYATSAAGALAVWEESQSDFYGTVDKYLAFAAMDPPLGFTERFAAVGIDNPIDPKFVDALAGTLYERLDLEGRRSELSRVGETVSRAALAQMLYDRSGESAAAGGTFADVAQDASYADAVAWAVGAGLIAGGDGVRLNPQGEITRVGAAAMLLRTEWLET